MRLETTRLILRPWEERDRDNYAALAADPQVRRFFPRVLPREEAIGDLERAIGKARLNGFHFGAAELKDDGEWLGLAGIGHVPDETREAIPTHPDIEIGWVLRPEFWGRGLAAEGAQAWLDYSWDVLDLPEMVAFTAAINTPSRRVMEKLGMTYDPASDFLSPRVPEGHALRPHVLYRIANPRRTRSPSSSAQR